MQLSTPSKDARPGRSRPAGRGIAAPLAAGVLLWVLSFGLGYFAAGAATGEPPPGTHAREGGRT